MPPAWYQLGLRGSGGRGTALRWRICFASFGFAAGQICVGRDSLEIGFRKRSRMIGKFFPQSGDLFFGNGIPGIAPCLSLISEDVSNLLVP